MKKRKQLYCVGCWLCVSSGFNYNTTHSLFIIYHTCCLCFHEDIWILGCHHLNCSGTNSSPSPVPPSTACWGQCAWNKWKNLLSEATVNQGAGALFHFTRKVTKSGTWSYQTPREIPSSDVRYMLMVWLREKSVGWLRSSKKGTLTAAGKDAADHWGGLQCF